MFKHFKERILELIFGIENFLIAMHSLLAQLNFKHRAMDYGSKAGLKVPDARCNDSIFVV
jgi:hypothetical protein